MELKLNAILKEEAKSKIVENKRSTFYGGKPTGIETDLYIGKTRVIIRQGIVQSEIPTEGPISEEITGFIVGVRAEFTMYEDVLGATRAHGKYVHPDDPGTTGIIEMYSKGTDKISCYGPTREKTLALFELIREGDIRPINEWDKAQITGGPDRLEQTLELLRLATAEQARLTREVEELRSAGRAAGSKISEVRAERDLAQHRVKSVQKLVEKLDGEKWPWCSKSAVANMINLAVNGGNSK